MKMLRTIMLAAVCATTTGITAASYRDVETTDVNNIESTPGGAPPAVATPTGDSPAAVVIETTVPPVALAEITVATVPDTAVPSTTSPSDLVPADITGSPGVDITK